MIYNFAGNVIPYHYTNIIMLFFCADKSTQC